MGVLLINQGTNSAVNFDLVGTVNTQVIGIGYGTVNTLGTLPNLPGGTLNLATISGNLGTIGTIGLATVAVSSLVNTPGGTINLATVSGNLGTIGTIGLATIAGNLGTVGTIGLATITGTVTGVGTVTNLGSVTNLGQLYSAGTLQGGTINTGTFVMTTGTLSPIPTIANVTYGTHSTTGASVFGTLAGGTGSGAGTEIFITSLSLSVPSTGGSQDCSIGWGTNAGTFQAGTGLLVRGNFPPGGGIQKTFWPPVNSGTQAQLCLFQAGAGTVDVSVSYFITASGL